VTPQRLRAHLSIIITLAGCAAFLTSVVALGFGVTSMAARYPLAVLGGYLSFVLLIRGWIALHQRAMGRRRHARSLDQTDLLDLGPDLLDLRVPARVPGPDVALFAGGRSGGAGAGAAFDNTSVGAPSRLNLDVDFDFDDLWPIVLAGVCVVGGVLAIGYVIYSAPVLLAEVAIDAAIMSGLYRRLTKRPASHWAMTVVRHTAIPALIVMVFAGLAGYAAQRLVPEARSIGGVIRALSE
jgi:hypothetical protein